MTTQSIPAAGLPLARSRVMRTTRRDLAAAVAAPVILTVVLVPFRASLPSADAALTMLVMVVAVATIGRRLAGLAAAASSAAWFDFSLTRPYEQFSLGPVDIETIILLVVTGAAVTELAVRARRRYLTAAARPMQASGQNDGIEVTPTRGTDGPARTESLGAQATATLSVTDTARPPAPRRLARLTGWRVLGGWPLLAILAIQAVLSLRLLRADTAFQDEALYLWAGHLQWAHWLHGAAIPPFPAYFSGAPVIYPPLGALADSIGGLAVARVLSLAFMLGATVLLWSSAGRLYGRRAAFFAAALFAVLGPTLHLGAFATYDAMSLFLVALAAWCVVRARDGSKATGWMVAAGAALALANAASYSSILFDLFVAALALLTAFPAFGRRIASRRVAIMLITAAVLLAAGLAAGGGRYLSGFEQAILARVPGTASPVSVLADSWSWAGLLGVLAVTGVVISWATGQARTRTWLLAILTAAAVLGPLNQARLHSAASLNEHVGAGAWFAAIAAGYAVDRFIAAAAAGRSRAITCTASVIALALPVSLGASQSLALATSWPNATSFIAILRPLADHGTGRLLVEDPAVARYYLPAGTQWRRWSSTRNIVLPSGASTGGSTTGTVTAPGDAGTFGTYIASGYFSLVALNFTDTTALDHEITADLRRNHHYRIIEVVPYGTEVVPYGLGTYIIWGYQPRK